ncbi:MAG TPA: zf-HC2 domain-containing protein [Phycisphaerae bacterium]|nr:zf-HC2 domain-containing protein [Phycisphaerae bacterium]
MSCHEFDRMASAYLDGELADEERRRFEEHLAACDACTRELAELKRLTEDLNMMRFKEPGDEELQRYWSGVYNRLERSIGWILLSVGVILTLCYGAFRIIEEMIRDPAISGVLKVGVCALIAGLVVLFVSLLRERLVVRKVDRYSREVER